MEPEKYQTCKQETHHKTVMFSSHAECAEQEGDHSVKGVKDTIWTTWINVLYRTARKREYKSL